MEGNNQVAMSPAPSCSLPTCSLSSATRTSFISFAPTVLLVSQACRGQEGGGKGVSALPHKGNDRTTVINGFALVINDFALANQFTPVRSMSRPCTSNNERASLA